MKIQKEIIKFQDKRFAIVKFSFNPKDDSKVISQLVNSGEELAKKLNPVLARDSSRRRNFEKVLANAIAGVFSEFCWKFWIKKIAEEKDKPIVLSSTDIDEEKNQIDILIEYTEKNKKNAEVRSSFPYAGLEKAITTNFDVIGWYCNEVKLNEIKKDYYLRALFPFHVDTFIQKISECFDIFLCGGASKKLLEESPHAKDKVFVPYDEVSFEKMKATKYRVIEPIINGYDTDKVTDLIIDGA